MIVTALPCLLAGPPATLEILPKEAMTVENGSPALYNIMVYDAAGNPTGDGRQVVNAWVSGGGVRVGVCESGGQWVCMGDWMGVGGEWVWVFVVVCVCEYVGGGWECVALCDECRCVALCDERQRSLCVTSQWVTLCGNGSLCVTSANGSRCVTSTNGSLCVSMGHCV